MKRKALCFVLALFVIAIFSLGCGGGGGGSSNPASSNIAGQARVSGVVYDSSNNPVPNASVKLALSSNALVNSIAGNINTNLRLAATANQTEFNTVTNAKGEYIFTNVPYGEYTLSAVTADGGQIVAHLDVRASVVVQPDMTIMPFGSITGVVTDSKSSAIKGALVYLDGTSYCSVTDAQGCYTINYVPVNTNFTLCAAASGYASLSRSVKILAYESLKLNTDNAFETVKFELSTVTAKAAVLSCTIAGSGAAQDNLVVIAVNQADGTTFVGSVVNSKSSLKITKTGKYDVFAASIGNGNNNIGDIITKQINDLNSTQEVELSIGMLTASSKYAVLSGSVVPADGISDTSFEVAVYDSTGHEHKQIAEANATFTFNNLPAGKYALAVSSDNSLYIRREITLSEGENKAITDKPIKTIKVAPSFSPATNNCYSELTGISNPAESGTTEVYFSAYGYDSESEPVLLYGYDKTNKRVSLASDSFDAGSVTNCSVCTDNCSKLGSVKFFFTNGLNKPVFEKTFKVADKTPDNRKLSLKANGSNINQNDVILFKAIEYQSKIYYLVVTSLKTYVLDSETGDIAELNGKKGEYDFATKLVAVDSNNNIQDKHFSSIDYGNVCFIPDKSSANNHSMAVQYCYVEDNDGIYYTYKYSVSDVFGESSSNNCIEYEPVILDGLAGFHMDKIIGRSTDDGIEIYSARGHFFKKINLDSNGVADTYNMRIDYDPEFFSITDSTVIFEPVALNSRVSEPAFYYLEKYPNNTLYFCKTTFNSDNNQESESLVPLGISGNYALEDCLDNIDAEHRVFINDNSGNTAFVLSDSLNIASNIKSSYVVSGRNSEEDDLPFDAWINRDSTGQKLVLRNLRTYKEKKIDIKQVKNSSAFLEGSIGFTTLNGNQIHALCANNSGNIQVMVINCVDSNN
jgi:hypothetical protein